MYYSEDNDKIYAEYMPDSHRYYGQIAAVSMDGTMGILQDSIQRSGESVSGNDMLMFVGTEGNSIYC